MSKLGRLIADLCPNGVEYVKFGRIAHIVRGASPRPISNFITDDEKGVNWIKIGDASSDSKYITTSKEKITLKGAEKSRYVRPGDFVLSNSMSFGRPYIMKTEGCIHDGWLAISRFDKTYTPDFLYYLLSSRNVQRDMGQRASNGTVQNLNADIVKALELPLAPLPVQREIVRLLDHFTSLTEELIKELTEEFTARKKQYEYYRHAALKSGDGTKTTTLGDVAEVVVGSKPKSIIDAVTDYEYINAGTSNSGYTDISNCDGETVTTPSRGQGGIGFVGYQKKPFWLGPLCYKIRTKDKSNIFTKYLYYYLQENNAEILRIKKEGGVPAINKSDLMKIQINIPSYEEQKLIVGILDRFDTLCIDLSSDLSAEIEARRKQYEYYRDKLLTFPDIKQAKKEA